MQNPLGVSEQLRRLHHGRVFPDRDLVVGESVGGDQLLEFAGPKEGTHLIYDIKKSIPQSALFLLHHRLSSLYLGLGVDGVEQLSIVAVPDFDRPVRGSSARSQDAGLPRTPGNTFHGSLMLAGNKTQHKSIVLCNDLTSHKKVLFPPKKIRTFEAENLSYKYALHIYFCAIYLVMHIVKIRCSDFSKF